MNKTITVRTVSPSQVAYQNHLKSTSTKNIAGEMNRDGGENVSPTNGTRSSSPTTVSNLRSKSQVIINSNSSSNGQSNLKQQEKEEFVPSVIINEMDNQIILSNNHFLSKEGSPANNQNNFSASTCSIQQSTSGLTIWREELNAKNNVQEQIKKQVTAEFSLIRPSVTREGSFKIFSWTTLRPNSLKSWKTPKRIYPNGKRI
jgi:hypothetical protein